MMAEERWPNLTFMDNRWTSYLGLTERSKNRKAAAVNRRRKKDERQVAYINAKRDEGKI